MREQQTLWRSPDAQDGPGCVAMLFAFFAFPLLGRRGPGVDVVDIPTCVECVECVHGSPLRPCRPLKRPNCVQYIHSMASTTAYLVVPRPSLAAWSSGRGWEGVLAL